MEFKVISLKPHSLSQVVWYEKNKFIMKNRYKRNGNFIYISINNFNINITNKIWSVKSHELISTILSKIFTIRSITLLSFL